MANRRIPVRIEFRTPAGVRFELDDDGWRLLCPRSLGEAALTAARELLEQVEDCTPPQDPDSAQPPGLLEIADHAARTHNLRIIHRYFKNG